MSSLYACGGEERVVSLMVNEWAKQHEVTIFTFENRENEGNRNDYYLSDKIEVKRVYNLPDNIFQKVIKLLYYYTGMTSGPLSQRLLKWAFYPGRWLDEWNKRLQKENFDVVIAVSGLYTMLLGYIADDMAAKTISWEHSSYEGYFDSKRGYYRNRSELYRKCAQRLDNVVVLNEDISRKYKENLNLKTTVIYNPKSFESSEKADMGQKLFITCGRLEAEKSYDDMITAFYYFQQESSDWKLMIIGGGSLQKSLEKQVQDYGITDKVIITGYIHDVSRRLREGSVFLMTSRWEGFPMSVTEALETGLPVISYDIPAMKPLVTDGVEGRLVSAFENKGLVEAMKELAYDEGKRRRMSEAAIRKAARLSPENIAKEWDKLFDMDKEATLC